MKKAKLQKSDNPEYWITKIEKNMERDHENDLKLQFLGWTVIHFWGADIKKNLDDCIRVIEEAVFDSMISDTGSYADDE